MLTVTVLFEVLSAWLLADLITGIVHWIQDKYVDHNDSIDFLDSIAEYNELHHQKPTAMIQNSGWTNMQSSFYVSTPVALGAWLIGAPLWLWLACFFCGFGNLVHRWAHLPKRRLNWGIRFMQWTGLFISHEHHDRHHRSMEGLVPKHLSGYRFCPMTNWVNPVLDSIRFWPSLEHVLSNFGLDTIRRIE
ncbi:MAG: fatty acid desaturase CarF family protein [Pirellulaceae bacterium]|nr:fatty acid desaturase CarF family protein [Pirellulaceae bacterium]